MNDRCLDAVPLLGPALDGELPESDAAWLEEHVAGCPACRDRQALLAAQGAALRSALTAKADQGVFSRFADRVLARVQTDEAAHRKAPRLERLAVWLREAFAANRFAFGVGAGAIGAAAVVLLAVHRPPMPSSESAALAAADIPAHEAEIERLDVYGQEGTVLQLPGQTVIWVSDEPAQPRSAQ
jgi:anti-sigma factor RsiW